MNFLTVQDYIVMGCGCAALLAWMVLFFATGRYNSIFDVLEEKEYPLKELYGMGYGLMELISYSYKGRYDRRLRTMLSVLYEEKYVEYYLRVVYAQSISISLIVFLFGFILYGFSRDIMIMMIVFMLAGVTAYYYMTLAKGKIQKRSEELLNDFCEIVSKLALLINAGMIMREAWNETACGGKGTIYTEMQRACDDMANGVSEIEAIRRFGVRCMIPEIKNFPPLSFRELKKETGNWRLHCRCRAMRYGA